MSNHVSSPLIEKIPGKMSNHFSSPLIEKIPGDYGLPLIGAVKDRWDFFYNQGRDEFFRTRMIKYQSTIFRANMPPGPFISSNPRVIVLLDAVSFPILFDNAKVEKKNILDGTYMPSTSFFGGYRPCAFLDTTEPKHVKLKQLFLSLLASRRERFIPLFRDGMSQLFKNIESQVWENSSADFNTLSDSMSFGFVFSLVFDRNPTETKLGTKGDSIITTWVALQLAPIVTLGLSFLPNFLEDSLIHIFPLPFFPAKSGYNKFYESVRDAPVLDEAEKLGIGRDEAIHNLIFLAGFNAFGGMKVFFPTLIKWIGLAGEDLHKKLVNEIRAVASSSTPLTFGSLEKLALTKSVVYETLRIEPPVPYQYAKAREDLVVQSHDATFEVKKGEMMFGYQPFATKDPKVFDNPEEFVADRFVGEEGQKLLKYVYWSNGRETEDPSTENKQCPAKGLVVLLSTVMVAEFFLRYDTFTVGVEESSLAATIKIKSLLKVSTLVHAK